MELNIEQSRELLVRCADAIIDNVELLTKADQAIGDGDHGVGMKRGFTAAKQAVAEIENPTSVGQLFKAGGQAIIGASGGASGVIFGLLLRAGGKVFAGETLDAAGFVNWLNAANEQIQTRGKAKPGDKTMLDALDPAAKAGQEALAAGLLAVVKAAADGAKAGVEKTKDMVATFGKAKALGDRSLGSPDPGAISTSLILEAAAKYVAELG